MSLVKSAFVLLSALLCQSCTQALPSPYQWEGIPENRFAPVAPLSPLTHRSSPTSDFSTKRIMPSTNTFEDEIDVHNRKFSMVPKHHSKAPRNQSNFKDFLKFQYPSIPTHFKKHRSSTKTRPFKRYSSGIFNERSGMGLPGSIIASGVFSENGNFVGDLHFTQPELFDAPRTQQPGNEFETSGKRYVTREDLFSELRAIEKALQKLTFAIIQIDDGFNSNTFTTSPQPPVLIDPHVASDSEPKEPSVEGVTSPTVTTSPQPPVLNNPSVISKQGPIEANTKEEVTYPTVASSAQPPVPIDSSVTSKQGPIEANNEEKFTYPTLTTSMKPPVLMDPREQYELQILESLYKTMHENNARKEEEFEKDF